MFSMLMWPRMVKYLIQWGFCGCKVRVCPVRALCQFFGVPCAWQKNRKTSPPEARNEERTGKGPGKSGAKRHPEVWGVGTERFSATALQFQFPRFGVHSGAAPTSSGPWISSSLHPTMPTSLPPCPYLLHNSQQRLRHETTPTSEKKPCTTNFGYQFFVGGVYLRGSEIAD